MTPDGIALEIAASFQGRMTSTYAADQLEAAIRDSVRIIIAEKDQEIADLRRQLKAVIETCGDHGRSYADAKNGLESAQERLGRRDSPS